MGGYGNPAGPGKGHSFKVQEDLGVWGMVTPTSPRKAALFECTTELLLITVLYLVGYT